MVEIPNSTYFKRALQLMVPIFTSAYSFRSILSLEPSKDFAEGGPDSIFEICESNGIDHLILVEDNMAAFLEAKRNCGDKIKLTYGVRVNFCNSLSESPEEIAKSKCRYVIFANDDEGYFKLVEVFTKASAFGKAIGEPFLDFQSLKPLWNDHLTLAVPFYDSFIHRNLFSFSKCVPDFSFCKPVFFIEDNYLFFDGEIEAAVRNYVGNNHEILKTKTILYKSREDFIPWMAYRCSQNRTTLETPNLDFCCSNEFCFEAFSENK